MTDLAISIEQWQQTVTARTCDLFGSYVGAGDPCSCPPCRTCDGDRVVLADARNGKVHVTAADLSGDNGMVHVIDGVLLP